jgi:hypothetical protein
MDLLFIALILLITPTESLIGYDCAGQGLNITTLSLTDIGDCNVNDIEPRREEAYLQLLQLSDIDQISVIQCKVEVDRTIFYCGMHSHISIVHNGKKSYIQELGHQGCRRIQETGIVTIGTAIIDRVMLNETSHHSITLAGLVTVDGKCDGTQYTDGYGTCTNVVVQAAIKITLRQFKVAVKHSTGVVLLPSGTHCDVQIGRCMDTEGGETYWLPLPMDNCHFDRYDVLYEGTATRPTSREPANQTDLVVYTVTTGDTTFALARITETNKPLWL